MQSMNSLFKRYYVSIMMLIVGRSLSAISKIDKETQDEVKGLPKNYCIEMKVAHGGPKFKVLTTDSGTLDVVKDARKADLSITFKHISHACLVFSFQEGTAQSFARDRMIADGELSHAVRLVRILNKLEALILPKFIARRAVKRYPSDLGLKEKITKALLIYTLTIRHLILGK